MSLEYQVRPKLLENTNLKGNVIKFLEIEKKGDTLGHEKGYYLKDGKLLLYREIKRNYEGEVFKEQINTYNEKIQCVEMQTTNEGGVVEKSELFYSDDGKLEKQIKHFGLGVSHQYIYDYESVDIYSVKVYSVSKDDYYGDRLIRYMKYGPNNMKIFDQIHDSGNVVESWQFRYDSKGNLTSYSWFKANENIQNLALFHQRIYEYDENDNLTAEIWLDAYGNLLEKRIYEYYENGYYIIEFWLDENEKVDDKTEYKFDNNHNLIEKIYDNNYGNPSHSFFNYKFDENGNWIVQEEVINNKKYKEVKREISYIDSN